MNTPNQNTPFVYLVGAGPGDPSLLTVRAKELLQVGQAVLYDSLVDASVLNHCRPDCDRIYVGKTAGHHSMKQEEINRLLVETARSGKTVIRLKGGDPFVFGRGAEECRALRAAGIPYEVVPGVTSAVSVPMSAGIPVTCRGVSSSFTVITGHSADQPLSESIDYASLAEQHGTIVILMGLHNLPELCSLFIKAGMDPALPGAVISCGTSAEQHVVRAPVSKLAEAVRNNPEITAPAIIVLGACSALDLRSPSGRRIAVCGSADFCQTMQCRLLPYGAAVQPLPYVRLCPLPDSGLREAVSDLSQIQILVFTGRRAVRFFFEEFIRQNKDLRSLAGIRIAVIGPGTAEALAQYHLNADWMPEAYNSDALADCLLQNGMPDDRILIPRAARRSPVLAERLTAAGRSFTELSVYEAKFHPAGFRNLAAENPVPDAVVFGSAEGVHLYFQNGGALSPDTRPFCIGTATAAALKEEGTVHFTAAESSSADGLLRALLSNIIQ